MEARLERIREIARERGVVEDGGVRPEGSPLPVASAATGYYGTPLLKRPVWTWEVPLYFFVGGIAGGAAVIGEVARLSEGSSTLVKTTRLTALAGAMLSAPLLISDLGRPERFLYMLRVFKPRSPMSVGVWTLAGFSTSAAVAAILIVAEGDDRSKMHRVASDAAGSLLALFGAAMSSYTGVLIGATVIPAWNRRRRTLPIEFAMSGLAAASSLLELFGRSERALRVIGGGAALVETGLGGVDLARQEARSDGLSAIAYLLSGPVPLLLRTLGARSKKAGRAAAVSAIAGSLLTRFARVREGRESADDSAVRRVASEDRASDRGATR